MTEVLQKPFSSPASAPCRYKLLNPADDYAESAAIAVRRLQLCTEGAALLAAEESLSVARAVQSASSSLPGPSSTPPSPADVTFAEAQLRSCLQVSLLAIYG